MSDSGTPEPARTPTTAPGTSGAPADRLPGSAPDPIAVLVLDTATGRLAACNPAARRRLSGTTGARFALWLSVVATAPDHPDEVTVRSWSRTDLTDSPGARAVVLRTSCAPAVFRSRSSLLVVVRDATTTTCPPPWPQADDLPMADPWCAVFTMDVLGRVDSWGASARSLVGFPAEVMLGAHPTPLYPTPAHHQRALLYAHRAGDHRTEGWRLCADGRVLWAEIVTVPLYDAVDRLLGFAQTIQDLTPLRRLHPRPLSSPRSPAQPVPPTVDAVDLRDLPRARTPSSAVGRPPGAPARGSRRPAGRIPGQRHP